MDGIERSYMQYLTFQEAGARKAARASGAADEETADRTAREPGTRDAIFGKVDGPAAAVRGLPVGPATADLRPPT